jgi:hypothetical protein
VQEDFHARAYAVLVTARSARMAEALSLPAAASSERCTICHSPFQSLAPVRRAETAYPDEGVSCESCHAAAGPWLRGHTRKDWTYATRVGAGLRDLRNFYVRANTCVACHQNLAADLLQAGHPELTFELDGQAVAEPKHWRDQDPASGPRAWLVGQAVAWREISWMLANSETPAADAIDRWSALNWLLAKSDGEPTAAPSGRSAQRNWKPRHFCQDAESSRRARPAGGGDSVGRSALKGDVAGGCHNGSGFWCLAGGISGVPFSSCAKTCPRARSALVRG